MEIYLLACIHGSLDPIIMIKFQKRFRCAVVEEVVGSVRPICIKFQKFDVLLV